MPTIARTRTVIRRDADAYRKRQRDARVDRLMRLYGLSREYARTVVALVYKRAG